MYNKVETIKKRYNENCSNTPRVIGPDCLQHLYTSDDSLPGRRSKPV